MQNILLATCFLLGLALGMLLVWIWLRPKAQQASERARAEWEPERAVLNERLENRTRQFAELENSLEQTRLHLADTFKALSAQALETNNRMFLDLAKASFERTQETARGDLQVRQQAIAELVGPVRESLAQVDRKIQDLEKDRAGAHAALAEQVRALIETQGQLRSETSKLVTALRSPGVRGLWGEMQLKRVVELAGMLEHCDFYSQPMAVTEDGRLRPDLSVRLPEAAKSSLWMRKRRSEAYLAAHESVDEETRRARLVDHARQVRNHME